MGFEPTASQSLSGDVTPRLTTTLTTRSLKTGLPFRGMLFPFQALYSLADITSAAGACELGFVSVCSTNEACTSHCEATCTQDYISRNPLYILI